MFEHIPRQDWQTLATDDKGRQYVLRSIDGTTETIDLPVKLPTLSIARHVYQPFIAMHPSDHGQRKKPMLFKQKEWFVSLLVLYYLKMDIMTSLNLI